MTRQSTMHQDTAAVSPLIDLSKPHWIEGGLPLLDAKLQPFDNITDEVQAKHFGFKATDKELGLLHRQTRFWNLHRDAFFDMSARTLLCDAIIEVSSIGGYRRIALVRYNQHFYEIDSAGRGSIIQCRSCWYIRAHAPATKTEFDHMTRFMNELTLMSTTWVTTLQ